MIGLLLIVEIDKTYNDGNTPVPAGTIRIFPTRVFVIERFIAVAECGIVWVRKRTYLTIIKYCNFGAWVTHFADGLAGNQKSRPI